MNVHKVIEILNYVEYLSLKLTKEHENDIHKLFISVSLRLHSMSELYALVCSILK
jgi:hypothetical protein